MNKIFLLELLVVCVFTATSFAQERILPEKAFTEIYFDTTVIDYYRYMEDPNSVMVQEWFKRSNTEARNILNNISGRKELVEQFLDFEKRKTFTVTLLITTEDGACFYVKKTENDPLGKLYFRKKKDTAEELLYDPQDYKKESGNDYSISYFKPSWDSKFIAISFSKNGEEIAEIAFFDTQRKILLPDIITHCWPAELAGISWLPDNSGIVYVNIPDTDIKSPNYILNTESVVYKLRDPVTQYKTLLSKKNNTNIKIESADFPIIEPLNPKDSFVLGTLGGAAIYTDYYYARIAELRGDKVNWIPLIKKEEGILDPIVVNDYLYCLSSKGASNFKIIRTNILKPDFEKPEVIVEEDKNESIDNYVVTKNGVFYSTTKNGVEAKLYFVSNNVKKEITLPVKAGNIKIATNNKYGNDFWVTISGWLNSNRTFQYDVVTNKFVESTIIPLVSYPEFDEFIVEEIEIPSHDGVLVPVSLIYKKKIVKNKNNNVLMDGYGAYGISKNPRFDPVVLSWVMNDGIYIVPHVRGGGEKGDDWHTGGMKNTKSNTWMDFIATAEYLIDHKITSNKKIAVLSGSAGAILVGRAMTARPDLFKVMMCYNGLLNPLRINEAPNGPNNMKELGNPTIKEEFKMLFEIDSYHHIKKGMKYPACLISVGMNDARVATWMSGKFVAKLQAATVSKNPILFVVDYNAGHGMENSNLQIYNDYADEFAFAFWQLGHPKFHLMK